MLPTIKEQPQEVDKLRNRLLLKKILWIAQSSLDGRLRMKESPQIIAVGIGSEKIKLMLTKPADPPEGFISVNQTVWEIKISSIENLSSSKIHDHTFPFFGLIGYYQGTNSFYLNLEICQSLKLRGEHQEIISYISDLSHEMLSMEENKFRIFGVGCGHELSNRTEFMVVDRLSDILPVVEKQAQNFRHFTSTKEVVRKGFMPILVIDPFTDNQELIARLELLTGKGVTSIAGYGSGDCIIEVLGTDINLSPLGLELKRNPGDFKQSKNNMKSFEKSFEKNGNGKLASHEQAKVFLKEIETKEGGIKGGIKINTNINTNISADTNSNITGEKELPEIHMLGAIKIQNAIEQFTSHQSISLVCYLAAHRNGVTSDQMMRWIWPPDEPPTRQILANVVSKARRSLGYKANGKAYIYYENGIYRLDSAVVTDYEIFRDFIKKAALEENVSVRIKFLYEALSLVKGVPLSMGNPKAFLWVDNGFRTELEYEIDTAAHELCDLAVSQNNFEIARFAVSRGVICIPGCDQCMARLLIIAAKSQNFGALIKTKSQMIRTYESLGYDVPKSLMELFEELYENVKDGDLALKSI